MRTHLSKLTVILLSIFILNLMFPIRAKCQKIGNNILVANGFTETYEEWKRIGADYQIDSNDNDTSYAWFNYTNENGVKSLGYFTFQNIKVEVAIGGFNVTSILSVTANYTIRCDTAGQVFRFQGWWWNGTDWYEDGGYATSVADWFSPTIGKNLTDHLNTPEKVQNVWLLLRNHGAPSYDNEGRISYVKLTVSFTYEEIYIYPLRLIIGLLGLTIMIISPTLGVREVLKNKNYEMIGGCIALFCIGYAFVIVWLIP